MKRFYLATMAFCVLFWSLSGCRLDGETSMPSDPSMPDTVKTETSGGDPESAGNIGNDDDDTDDTGNSDTGNDNADTGNTGNGNADTGNTGNGNTGSGNTGIADGGKGSYAAPKMLINELRTEARASSIEYVEFKMLSDGNLGGLKAVIYRSNAKTPFEFEFPATEVGKGEYVVLYLRTADKNGQPYPEESPGALSFRIPGNGSWLNKSSTVYVEDRDGGILSAVMLFDGPETAWEGPSKGHFADVAKFLFERGAWKSSDGRPATPADAVQTSGIGNALTRSVSRDESVADTNTAADWYVTVTGGATPGLPNNPKRLP